MVKKVFFLCFLLSVVLISLTKEAFAGEAGFLVYTRGVVQTYSPAVREWVTVQLDKKSIKPVFEGDSFYTHYDSVAIIILSSGVCLRVSANSQLEIKKDSPARLKLKNGYLWLKIPQRLNGLITVETPNTTVYSGLGAIEIGLRAGSPSTEVKVWAGTANIGQGRQTVKLCQYQQAYVLLKQKPSQPVVLDRQKKQDWSNWNLKVDELYYDRFFTLGKVKREVSFVNEFIASVPVPPVLGYYVAPLTGPHTLKPSATPTPTPRPRRRYT